jgi:hypothetical protein
MTYPLVKQLLDSAIQDFAEQRDLSIDSAILDLERRSGVKAKVIHSWRFGTRFPDRRERLDKLKELCEILAPGGNLFSAVVDAAKTVNRSFAERLNSGDLCIYVQDAKYIGAGRFWASTWERFAQNAAIRTVKDEKERDFLQLRDSLFEPGSSLDIATGILVTPELETKMKFFAAPVFYRLSAVWIPSRWQDTVSAQRFRQAFAADVPPGQPSMSAQAFWLSTVPQPLEVIAMRGEVGHIYAQQVLGQPIHEGTLLTQLDANQYAQRLLASQGPALVIADEITCLEVLKVLRSHDCGAELVFPLRTRDSSQRLEPCSLLPEYSLGLALGWNPEANWENQQLFEFLNTSLEAFLLSNRHWVAKQLIVLRDEVLDLAIAALGGSEMAHLESWADHCFRIDTADPIFHWSSRIDWRPVLSLVSGNVQRRRAR